MKKVLAPLFWLLLALAGAGAYATLAFRRSEPVNSGCLLIAAVCTYAIGYRFYSKWIAARALALDNRRATPCDGSRRWPGLRENKQVHCLRPSFRGDSRTGTTRRAGAGRAIWLPARRVVDFHRRGAWRRGAGFRDPVLLDPARRQIARPDGEGGIEFAGGFHRACWRSWPSW